MPTQELLVAYDMLAAIVALGINSFYGLFGFSAVPSKFRIGWVGRGLSELCILQS